MQRIIQLILSLIVAFLGVQFTHGEQANVALDGTAYIVNGELYPANWTIAQMNDGDKRAVFHGDVAGVILRVNVGGEPHGGCAARAECRFVEPQVLGLRR